MWEKGGGSGARPVMRRFHTGAALLLVLLLVLLPACRDAGEISRTQTRYLFDTVIKITVYDPYTDRYYRQAGRDRPDLDGALTGAMELCQGYENLLSRTKEGSDIWRLNHAGGQPVEVDPDTAALLQKCLYYGEKTGGAFDVTIAPASLLWDFHADSPALPDPAELAGAAARVDYRQVYIDSNTVSLSGGAMVDLGGSAKGFIADKTAAYLRGQGVDCFLLNFGGNLLAAGGKAERRLSDPAQRQPFSIGVRDPFGSSSDLAATVKLSEGSVVTSGTYERYFTLDGRRYHHILDPATGRPVENGLESVTIFSDQSADGDILSTSCFVLGPDRGMELIESLPGTEALFIYEDGSKICSSGATLTGEPGKIQIRPEG